MQKAQRDNLCQGLVIVLTSLGTFRHKRLTDTLNTFLRASRVKLAEYRVYRRADITQYSCMNEFTHSSCSVYWTITVSSNKNPSWSVPCGKFSLRLRNEDNKLQTFVLTVDMSMLSHWVWGVKLWPALLLVHSINQLYVIGTQK